MLEIIKHGRLAKDSIPEGCEEACTRMVDEGFLQVVTPECSRYYMTDVVGTVNVHAATQSPSSKKRTLNSPTKAKKPKVESPSSSIPAVYYRLNTRTFITALWQQQLTEITRRRINEAASAVMHAAFTCLGLRAATGGLTFNAFQVSTKLPSGTPLLVDNNSRTMGEHSPLTQYLDCLAQELDFIKKLDTRTGGTYSIDERASIHYCRMRTIESFIATRFGAASVRILRILQDKKMLEEKTISKIAMITAKETRERLYQMLAVGLVHLQEVPKTLDHAPSRTFFLWTIPIPLIFTRISEMALRSVGNLLIRAEAEYQRQHLLVVKSERSDVAANPSLLSETEQRQLNTLKKTLDRLHVSCCRIISEYLILQHY